MSSMLVPMLLADAKSAAERAAWEAQRRGVSTYDEQTGICIPGSAICDKNLVIALAVVGFLWLSTCGGVSVIVAIGGGEARTVHEIGIVVLIFGAAPEELAPIIVGVLVYTGAIFLTRVRPRLLIDIFEHRGSGLISDKRPMPDAHATRG